MIEFEEVSVVVDGRTLLRDLTLTLPERRVGIIGANGSGKSTLARLINGLVRPTTGRVRVDGLDTVRDAAAVRRKVGFCFSDPDTQILMPTVAEDVAFSLRRSGLDRAEITRRVQAALREFGLLPLAEQPAHQLSSGEKQLLALASTLVREPDVVVADEPTTLLDLRNSRLIHARLTGLPQQVVLVTHHLDFVAECDRVLVVEDGLIACDDTAEMAVAWYVERSR